MILLTKKQVEEYRKVGFLSGIPIANHSETEYYRRSYEELEAREGKQSLQHTEDQERFRNNRHFDQRFVWEIATHPKVLECVETITGTNIILLWTYFFSKRGPDKSIVAWHQDATRLGI